MITTKESPDYGNAVRRIFVGEKTENMYSNIRMNIVANYLCHRFNLLWFIFWNSKRFREKGHKYLENSDFVFPFLYTYVIKVKGVVKHEFYRHNRFKDGRVFGKDQQ